MNRQQKLLTGSAVGLLLGFGLCGVDQFYVSGSKQEFGGPLSLLGSGLCFLCAPLLIAALFALLLPRGRTLFSNYKGKNPRR